MNAALMNFFQKHLNSYQPQTFEWYCIHFTVYVSMVCYMMIFLHKQDKWVDK